MSEQLVDNHIIIIDVGTIPTGWNVEDWVKYTRQSKTVFYDSTSGGNEPQIIPTEGDTEIQVIDYSTKEGKKIFKDLNKK